MRYPSVLEFYQRLGQTPIPQETFERVLDQNQFEATVKHFAAVEQGYRERGDEESNAAFYQCFYTDRIPELDITWSEAYARVYSPAFETVVLPELARFCDYRNAGGASWPRSLTSGTRHPGSAARCRFFPCAMERRISTAARLTESYNLPCSAYRYRRLRQAHRGCAGSARRLPRGATRGNVGHAVVS